MSKKRVDPYLISVLSSRIKGISLEMSNTMLRTARSQVISICKDFSTAILDRNGGVIALPTALISHCSNVGLTIQNIMKHPEGIQEGDLFLHNSPYHGGSHAADYTYVAPVFNDGELLFWCAVRGHQADCGNSIPTTYNASARDVYEEGAIIFPGVKIQKNFEHVHDIIGICMNRIRVPQSWYGDYLAGAGAARTGERQLNKVCKEYGNELIKEFCDQYQDYASRLFMEEIKKLPDKKVTYDFTFDAIPGVYEEDISIHLEAEIDFEAGDIIVDATKNVDNIAWGMNVCEGLTVGMIRGGVFTHFPQIPRVEGALQHIKVKIRDGCVIGNPTHPMSCSLATVNIADQLVSCSGVMMNQYKPETGRAESGKAMSVSHAVVSGIDFRKNDEPYINELILGGTEGPGVNGYDGWCTQMVAGTGGAIKWSNIEALEQQYPLLFIEGEVKPDTIGSGQWDSAPCCKLVFTTRKDPVTAIYTCDGWKNPSKGVNGGLDGNLLEAWKYKIAEGQNSRISLPPYSNEVITKEEALVSECQVGGGYGNPLDRDPEKVLHRVNEGWITKEYAQNIYGVVIDTSKLDYSVDYEATKKLREEKRKGGC